MIYLEVKKQTYMTLIYTETPPPPHPPLCSLVPSPMLALDLLLALQFIWMCEERKQVSDGHSRSGNSKGQVSKRKNASERGELTDWRAQEQVRDSVRMPQGATRR